MGDPPGWWVASQFDRLHNVFTKTKKQENANWLVDSQAEYFARTKNVDKVQISKQGDGEPTWCTNRHMQFGKQLVANCRLHWIGGPRVSGAFYAFAHISDWHASANGLMKIEHRMPSRIETGG